jgi:L-iditol 2-dehydrogenase
MGEMFAISAENLTDTLLVGDMDIRLAALIEPLACVMKSIRLSQDGRENRSAAVVGMGVMGLMHALALGDSATGYDLSEARLKWAQSVGIRAVAPELATPADVIFVCPGSQAAFDLALKIAKPGATIVMFAPLGPGLELKVPQSVYFKDIRLIQSYSCGPDDTVEAAKLLRSGKLKAEHVVSNFIGLDELPQAYEDMKAGRILKAMVLFGK